MHWEWIGTDGGTEVICSMSKPRPRSAIPHRCVCGKMFFPRIDLLRQGRGKFCSVKCCALERSTNVDEPVLVREYLETAIGIKQLAKRYRIGQARAVRILRDAGVDTSLGRRRHANGSCARTYRRIVEDSIGRSLSNDEWVHHIDGDRTNNRIDNLCVMTDLQHRTLHRQIEQVTFELYKAGLVTFNRVTLSYEMTTDLERLVRSRNGS